MEKDEVKKTTSKKTIEPIVKELEPMSETKVTVNLPMVVIAAVIVIAGGFTGYVLAKSSGGRGGLSLTSTGGNQAANVSKVVGNKCEQQGEVPEGLLKAGGIDGEGTHHLERDGGPARNVYLTSSVVPLDDYVDKKVRVCGETMAAQEAGWFMDVIKLEVIE